MAPAAVGLQWDDHGSYPILVTDSRGEPVLAYVVPDQQGHAVRVIRHSNAGWTQVGELLRETDVAETWPQLTLDRNDEPVVSWNETAGGWPVREFDRAGWQVLPSLPGEPYWTGSVRASPDGELYVGYRQIGPASKPIVARLDANGWGDVTPPIPQVTADQENPVIGWDGQRRLVAVWAESATADDTPYPPGIGTWLYLSRFEGGIWQPAVTLMSSDAKLINLWYSVTTDANGQLAVAWSDLDTGFSFVSDSPSGVLGPTVTPAALGYAESLPSLTFDASNQPVIGTTDYEDLSRGVLTTVLFGRVGGQATWSSLQRTEEASCPQVAALGNGAVLFVWVEASNPPSTEPVLHVRGG